MNSKSLSISIGEVDNVLSVTIIIIKKYIYKVQCRATPTSDITEGKIRCHEGVSILC
jgi:hypothetical protein